MIESVLNTVYHSITTPVLFTNFFTSPFYFTYSVGFNDIQNNILIVIRRITSSNTKFSNDLNSTTPVNEVVSPTSNFSASDISDKVLTSGEELSSNFRYQKFSNPVFRYDYKAGNYFPKSDFFLHKHMFVTISEITGGIRKSA
jgi:hypothetical protein